MITAQMPVPYRQQLQVICLLTMLFSSGCQFSPNTSKMRWPWTKEKPAPQPDRILAVWTDTVLHQPSQPGVRGFGGRVYFYEQDESDPIEVDGGLAVYVFDADKLQTQDQRPLRKFVFTADQFATHMSKTSLGPSYSVWLPWGEVGGPPLRLSLIARYEGTAGGTTISDPTIKLLPGVPVRSVESERELVQQRSSSPYQLVGHTTAAKSGVGQDAEDESDATESDEKNITRPQRRTHNIKTIDLPPSFQRHLQHFDGQGSLEGGSVNEDHSTNSNPLTNSSTSYTPATTPIEQPIAITNIDSKSLQALSDASASAPLTTQVIDHRTRMQQRFHIDPTSSTSRIDIREGRWIESLPRTGRPD